MAQTGYTPLLIYSSTTAAAAPVAGNLTNSTLGSELAINITDGKLFYKDDTNTVQVIAWKTTPTTAGGTGLTSYTAGDLLYYASGTALSKLAIGATGRWLGSSGTAPQWNAPAALTKTDDTNVTLTLGGSASTALLNAASLTLGWTGQLAVSRGGTGQASWTANGILYASGTTTLATSTNWKYDGTNVTLTAGNLIQGTAAKGFNFTANTPAAGMTSQLLNWYEEGTFTPTIYGSSVVGTGTYSTQVGTYVRVGKSVTFTIILNWSAHTGSGNMYIDGLPFTSADATACAWRGDGITLTAGNYLTMSIDAGTNNILFVQTPTGTVSGNYVPLDTAGFIIVSGSYICS